MALDPYREIARIAEAALRAEFVTAFNNSMAGREDTGRRPIAFVGELARTRASQDKEKKSARRFLRDIQEIMRAAEMASYVAETVIGAKSDAEIAVVVAEIEAKTGRALEEYAARYLDAEALERGGDESEVDFQRRILKAIAEKITDPRTGRIKLEYADDPLAQIIMADEAYQSIMMDVAYINRGGIRADALVTKFADAGYARAELSAHYVEHDGHKRELRNGQHGHTDKIGYSDQSGVKNGVFFGMPDTNRSTGSPSR